MEKRYLMSGLIFAFFAVAIGAFGAHGLKSITSNQALLNSFETGVRYQFFHAIALLISPFILKQINHKSAFVFWSFISGILLFSGSIFVLVLAKINHLDTLAKIMGLITPIGGLLLLLGWVALFFKVVKSQVV